MIEIWDNLIITLVSASKWLQLPTDFPLGNAEKKIDPNKYFKTLLRH